VYYEGEDRNQQPLTAGGNPLGLCQTKHYQL
jgi:hypothetical protein